MNNKNFKNWLKSSKLKREIKSFSSILSNILNVSGGVNESEYRAHDTTLKYWQKPSKLQDWLNNHGINAEVGTIPEFKDGGAGRAYFIGKNVVKFSANPVEAEVAKMVSNNKEVPTPVIDVLHLDGNLHAILHHRVNMDAPQKIKDAADYVTAIVDDHPEMDGFPPDKPTQEKLSIETLKEYGGDMSLLPYMILVLSSLSKLYQATGFKHDDAGPTNIGMMDDKIVFTDLGKNQTKDWDAEKALEKIKQNKAKLGLN